jgi:hypothetical protein
LSPAGSPVIVNGDDFEPVDGSRTDLATSSLDPHSPAPGHAPGHAPAGGGGGNQASPKRRDFDNNIPASDDGCTPTSSSAAGGGVLPGHAPAGGAGGPPPPGGGNLAGGVGGLLNDGARDSSGYASESGDMLRELVKNKELLDANRKKNMNKVGSVDSDVSDSSILVRVFDY